MKPSERISQITHTLIESRIAEMQTDENAKFMRTITGTTDDDLRKSMAAADVKNWVAAILTYLDEGQRP